MPRRILLLGLTLVLAIAGTSAVLLYVRQADARAIAGKQTVTVLVAAKPVPAGTSAAEAERAGLVRAEQMPAETVPDDTLSAIDEELATQVASADIQAGQLLLRPMFGTRASRVSGLDLPTGKIALSVSLTVAQQVAGYVRAGSSIAVFDTFTVLEGRGRTPAGDGISKRHEYNHATRLLLAKVPVLAIGPAPAGDGDDSAADNSADSERRVLVTVAVTQAEAEKLVHGAQTGALYLALIGDDSDTALSDGVDNRSVFDVQ